MLRYLALRLARAALTIVLVVTFAFVVLRPGAVLSEDGVKRFALDNAPAYQHPRGVAFLPELPLATTNKVDRKALREMARERWLASAPVGS